MDDTTVHEDELQTSSVRPRRSMNAKAIPYGSDDMSAFFSDEWETPWEINHTVVAPRAVAG